jgi:tetratricopeptide (TPR) repeat protein
MSGHAAAIERLAGRVRGFLRDDGKKLLHVVCATELRRAALRLVTAAEHAPENRSPFVVLDAPHRADAPGWSLRIDAVRRQHDDRRDGADPPIAALAPAPPGDDARVGFAGQLLQILHACPAGTRGLVVVLAPAFVEAPKIWAEAVGLLVGGPRLSDVRWIVVDIEASTINPVVAALGDRAVQHDARIDGTEAHAALERLARGGLGAAPRGVIPPPRPDVPAPDTSPDAQRRGEVRGKVLQASLSLARGDGAGAVSAQRAARDLCAGAGWTRDAVAMELVLGGQLLASGQVRAGEESFGRAIEAARATQMHAEIATAGFALGATRMVRGERHTALVAYAEASLAAERSGDAMLAIEGSRLAGQTASELGMEPQAITFYTRAVKLADQGAPEVGLTSAAEAARRLATICRKRGLRPRAVELEAQAERFARPPEPAAARVVEVPEAPPAIERPEPAPAIAANATPSIVPAPVPREIIDRILRAPSPAPIVAKIEEAAALEPSELLGALPVPPDQLRFLPEGTALVDRRAVASVAPPADGTILLDEMEPGLAPAVPPRLLPPSEGTILLDLDAARSSSPMPLHASGPGPALAEGTGLLTLEEIADMHWGGVAPSPMPPAEGSRSWTRGEIEILQRAVADALEPEATLMLSMEELAALRGEKAARSPDAPRPIVVAGSLHPRGEGPMSGEGPIPGLEPMPGLEPAASLASPPKPARADTIDGDEVTMLTREDILKMRETILKARAAETEDE